MIWGQGWRAVEGRKGTRQKRVGDMRRMVGGAIRKKNNDTFQKVIMKSITLYANQKDHILKLCPH